MNISGEAKMAGKKETLHLNTETRPTRVPLDGPRNLLTIPQHLENPGIHYTWQHEVDVQRFLAAGYDFVTDPITVGDATVNSASRINAPGNAVVLRYKGDVLYLLGIDQDIYDEDQKRMEDQRREVEDQMRRIGEGEYGKVTVGR